MAESLTSKSTAVSLLGTCGVKNQEKRKVVVYEPFGQTLVYIVKPVNDVEKRKGDGEKHSGPLVYGIHISQVGDLDFELRGAPADAPLAVRAVPLERAPIGLAAAQGLAVLDAGAVVGVHGGLGVAHAREHLRAARLVPDLQGAEENVAVRVDLIGKGHAQAQLVFINLCLMTLRGGPFNTVDWTACSECLLDLETVYLSPIYDLSVIYVSSVIHPSIHPSCI